jgi:hypothetical protein
MADVDIAPHFGLELKVCVLSRHGIKMVTTDRFARLGRLQDN